MVIVIGSKAGPARQKMGKGKNSILRKRKTNFEGITRISNIRVGGQTSRFLDPPLVLSYT